MKTVGLLSLCAFGVAVGVIACVWIKQGSQISLTLLEDVTIYDRDVEIGSVKQGAALRMNKYTGRYSLEFYLDSGDALKNIESREVYYSAQRSREGTERSNGAIPYSIK